LTRATGEATIGVPPTAAEAAEAEEAEDDNDAEVTREGVSFFFFAIFKA